MIPIFIFSGIRVVANNIKVFGVAVKMKIWAPVPLLSIYKLFRTALKDNKH
jgi:hypothetical protein